MMMDVDAENAVPLIQDEPQRQIKLPLNGTAGAPRRCCGFQGASALAPGKAQGQSCGAAIVSRQQWFFRGNTHGGRGCV